MSAFTDAVKDLVPTLEMQDSPGKALVRLIPGLKVKGIKCPVSTAVSAFELDLWGQITHDGIHTLTLAHLIVHLNDDHRWKRERLADWLDSLDIDLSFGVTDD
jgi:hypothetical protein